MGRSLHDHDALGVREVESPGGRSRAVATGAAWDCLGLLSTSSLARWRMSAGIEAKVGERSHFPRAAPADRTSPRIAAVVRAGGPG